MKRHELLSILVLFGTLSLLGCGGASPSGGTSTGGDAAADTNAIKKYEIEKLPPIGDHLAPLNGGRIEIAPPKTWRPLARNPAYLAAFNKTQGSQLPLVALKLEKPEAALASFENVKEENVLAFSDALDQLLHAKHGADYEKKVLEDVRAIMIGSNAFARYVKPARLKSEVAVDVQVLVTIQAGQMYSLELQVVKGTIKNDRDFAYAVAGGLKYSAGSGAATTPEAKPEEKPEAEKKEAEKTEAPKKEDASTEEKKE